MKQDDPYYWIGRGILESKPGNIYYTAWKDEKPYISNKTPNLFKEKVYLLTSYETFSAGTYLVGLFKSNNLGTIVGRETGGRVYMTSDMMPVFLTYSNFMYLIPAAKLILSNENPNRGVMPGYFIDLKTEDYINYRDKDIEKIIELIKEDISVRNLDSLKNIHKKIK